MKRINNNRGFGLIETLISILLLSIVLVGGMSFYFNGDEFMALTTHKNIAAEIASSHIESLRRNGYSALPVSGTPVVDSTIKVGGLSATQTTTVTDQDLPVGGNPIDYKE